MRYIIDTLPNIYKRNIMTTTDLSLEEIYNLALKTLKFNGCDELNAEAVANTVTNAERDGSVSHGLFRIPGYIAALKSKKVKGDARPKNNFLTQNAIRVEGDYGFAPTAIGICGQRSLISKTIFTPFIFFKIIDGMAIVKGVLLAIIKS